MSDSRHRALVSVRAKRTSATAATRVFCRSHEFALGKPWSFDIREPAATGAELLLGILLSDVLELFVANCRNKHLAVDHIEATARAQLTGALAWLGVIGAEGEPAYEDFAISAYVDSASDESALRGAWDDAVRRAPFLNTLRRGTTVDVSLQIVR